VHHQHVPMSGVHENKTVLRLGGFISDRQTTSDWW